MNPLDPGRQDINYSFIIPSFNYARFLHRAVSTIGEQISAVALNCEIILVDDGSTDDTAEVCAKLSAQFPFFHYVFQENSGVSAARNYGASLARGDFLWFVDADDELLPDALRTMNTAREQNRAQAMIFGGYRSHARDGRKVEKLWRGGTLSVEESFLKCVTGQLTGLCIGSAILRREVFLRYQFPGGVQNGEDFILYAHIIVNEGFISIPHILLNTFRHEDSLRANLPQSQETGISGTDCLFDPTRLPAELMRLRPRYIADRHMTLGRLCYETKKYSQARSHYHQAFALYPRSMLKLSHLRKYLRCLVMR